MATRVLLLAALLAVAAPLCSGQKADEAGGSSCSAEAATLRSQLAEAQTAVAGLTAQLAAAPDAPAATKESSQLAAAAKRAKESLAAAEKKLEELQAKLKASEAESSRLAAELEQAKAGAASCTDSRSVLEQLAADAARQVEAARAAQAAAHQELAGMKEEIVRAHAEAAVHRQQYEELQAHHAAAWVPHWLDEGRKAALAAAGPALASATQSAKLYTSAGTAKGQALWAANAGPKVQRYATLARDQASELAEKAGAFLGRVGGKHLPGVKAAWAKHWPRAKDAATGAAAAVARHANAAWESEAVASVRPALTAAAKAVKEQSRVVVGELEALLIGLLKKQQSTIALARKPYVTYIVYVLLGAPLVALALPVLGLLRGGQRAAAQEESVLGPQSAKKKKKNKRISDIGDSARLP